MHVSLISLISQRAFVVGFKCKIKRFSLKTMNYVHNENSSCIQFFERYMLL